MQSKFADVVHVWRRQRTSSAATPRTANVTSPRAHFFSALLCSVSLTVEIPEVSIAVQESTKLYALLQTAVDNEIQQVGFMPDATTWMFYLRALEILPTLHALRILRTLQPVIPSSKNNRTGRA